MKRKPVSQCDLILNDLKRGWKIDPIKALHKHGIFRLAARIKELRRAGHTIETQMIKGVNGAGQPVRFAEYRLVKSA